jgi:hypothetical protein
LLRKRGLSGGGRMRDKMKNYFKKFKFWLIECLKFLKEIILFIVNLPIYLKRFLEGLRIFSKSYDEIINALKLKQEVLTRNDLRGINAETIASLTNEITRLKNEQEKMFGQLFSIFIASLALIISICALIINIKK